MEKGWKKIGFGVISLGVALGLVASACIPQVAKAEPKEAKIGFQAVFTGPLASTTAPICPGLLDYADFINGQGGIEGVQVKVMWEDSRGEVPRAIMAHKRFKVSGAVLEVAIASTTSEAVAPLSQRDEIPLIFQGDMTELMITHPLKWQFAGGPGYPNYGISLAKWVADNWSGPNPARLGVMIADYPSCWEGLNAIKQYGMEVGIEFVGSEVISFLGAIDTTVEWLRLMGKNPDWVWTAIPGGTSLVTTIKDAQRLEVREKGIKVAAAYTFTEELIPIVKEVGAEGWYIFRRSPTNMEAELPGMRAVFEAAKKHHGWDPEKVPALYIDIWILSQVGIEGIRLAIERVGFEKLTGRAVRDALVSIKDFDTGLIPPVTMDEKHPYYGNYYRMYQWQKGRLVPVGGWVEASPLGGYEY